jgi:endo-1,4-beta-xylanase
VINEDVPELSSQFAWNKSLSCADAHSVAGLDRRDLLRLGVLALGATVIRPAEAANAVSLQAIENGTPVLIGVAVGRDELGNAGLANFVVTNFGIMTPSYELKWKSLRPTPTTFNFTNSDWAVNFARSHNMRVHGHNLCWNQANPAWLATTLTKGNALSFLTNHIKTVMGRYRGQIDSWDVVNEPIHTADNLPGGMTDSIWLRLCGSNYVDAAFYAAREADPAALRVLNQDGLELDTDLGESTRVATLALVEGMVKRGVPVQAVGLEAHLYGSASMLSTGRTKFIRAIRALGLQVIITEMDINDTPIVGSDSARQKAVADDYYEFLTDVLPVSAAKRVIFWSPTDVKNWYDRTPSLARHDGGMHHPGLLDSNMQPAPAYRAVAAALQLVRNRTS